jgi:hypothetical protein
MACYTFSIFNQENQMKVAILLILTAIAFSSQASTLKSFDSENNCTLYRVPTEESPLTSDDVIVNERDAYGLSIVDMEIDFKSQKVSVQPIINIVLGVNRNLTNKRVTISSKNPEFKFLINQLNRKLYVFEKMCINSKNEIVYARQFEAQK